MVATSSLVLWKPLEQVYVSLGFDAVTDVAFTALVLGRIIEPASKADTLRVLAEVWVSATVSGNGHPVREAGRGA